MKNKKKLLLFILIPQILIVGIIAGIGYVYKRDKSKYEPKLWIGFFDYRLNFRDVGESLNKCLKKEVFNTGLIYRSNKYFSGWSCDKIKNPNKIYSLNFSPWDPHSYYCEMNDGKRKYGFHPNTTFEISDIENLKNWKTLEDKQTMCTFCQKTLTDFADKNSFLFHRDVGRDRTGAFAAMISMIALEQNNLVNDTTIEAIECDYEKTSALEKHKIGRMRTFMKDMQSRGGVSSFLEKECGITSDLMLQAANNFIKL